MPCFIGDRKARLNKLSRLAKIVLALLLVAALCLPYIIGSDMAYANTKANAFTSASTTTVSQSITLSKLPAKPKTVEQDSVTVIGDSVPLGAALWGNMKNRIANNDGVSWCDVDCKASRRLRGAVELARKLDAQDRLGTIVVFAVSTNGIFHYKRAKAARDAMGKHRSVIFVTGYRGGFSYTDTANNAVKLLAEKDDKVFVADWSEFVKSKGGAGLKADRCHLTGTSAVWYVDVVMEAIEQARKAKLAAAKESHNAKTAHIGSISTISLVKGTKARAPIAVWRASSAIGRSYKWSSSDSDIVYVDSSGKLTTKSLGNATITLEETGPVKRQKKIKVKVVPNRIKASSGLTLETVQLRAWAYQIKVSGANDKVTGVPIYKSVNPRIATVNNAGIVIGNRSGTTQIKVSYGSISKIITVNVE